MKKPMFCPVCDKKISIETWNGWSDVEWHYFKCKDCNLDGSYRIRLK